MTGKKIIVDIDNTLWDLSPELWAGLKAFNPDIPPPSRWNHWDFWEGYLSWRDLLHSLRKIHNQQDKYSPYPDSKAFLTAMKERGFYILIAGQREKETREPTVRWLKKHGLVFDEVHLLDDKSVLFEGSWAIIDDSPVTLEKAARAGILRAGLLAPWNVDSGHPLFRSLAEVLDHIDFCCHSPGKNHHE